MDHTAGGMGGMDMADDMMPSSSGGRNRDTTVRGEPDFYALPPMPTHTEKRKKEKIMPAEKIVDMALRDTIIGLFRL